MIRGHISDLEKYGSLHKGFSEILKFIKNNDLSTRVVGKYTIEGTDSFVLIQQYTTKGFEEIQWESHCKYIDVQYILSGAEKMGVMPVSQLTVSTVYSQEKDMTFYEEVEDFVYFEVKENHMAIFFPEDAHKPSCLIDKAREVKKAVFKVPVR